MPNKNIVKKLRYTRQRLISLHRHNHCAEPVRNSDEIIFYKLIDVDDDGRWNIVYFWDTLGRRFIIKHNKTWFNRYIFRTIKASSGRYRLACIQLVLKSFSILPERVITLPSKEYKEVIYFRNNALDKCTILSSYMILA